MGPHCRLTGDGGPDAPAAMGDRWRARDRRRGRRRRVEARTEFGVRIPQARRGEPWRRGGGWQQRHDRGRPVAGRIDSCARPEIRSDHGPRHGRRARRFRPAAGPGRGATLRRHRPQERRVRRRTRLGRHARCRTLESRRQRRSHQRRGCARLVGRGGRQAGIRAVRRRRAGQSGGARQRRVDRRHVVVRGPDSGDAHRIDADRSAGSRPAALHRRVGRRCRFGRDAHGHLGRRRRWRFLAGPAQLERRRAAGPGRRRGHRRPHHGRRERQRDRPEPRDQRGPPGGGRGLRRGRRVGRPPGPVDGRRHVAHGRRQRRGLHRRRPGRGRRRQPGRGQRRPRRPARPHALPARLDRQQPDPDAAGPRGRPAGSAEPRVDHGRHPLRLGHRHRCGGRRAHRPERPGARERPGRRRHASALHPGPRRGRREHHRIPRAPLLRGPLRHGQHRRAVLRAVGRQRRHDRCRQPLGPPGRERDAGRHRHAAAGTTAAVPGRPGHHRRRRAGLPGPRRRQRDRVRRQRRARGPGQRGGLQPCVAHARIRRHGRPGRRDGHRQRQLHRQRRRHAVAAVGDRLHARLDRQRPDADAAGLGRGEFAGPVERHDDHGRRALQLGRRRGGPRRGAGRSVVRDARSRPRLGRHAPPFDPDPRRRGRQRGGSRSAVALRGPLRHGQPRRAVLHVVGHQRRHRKRCEPHRPTGRGPDA